eukprot:COSAG04_NODE_11451_length_708_cov_1.098522_1_plen_186_part_10
MATPELRQERVFGFDPAAHDLRGLISRILLHGAAAQGVGLQQLHTLPEFQPRTKGRPTLINKRWRNKGGGEAGDLSEAFRRQFGRFVDEVVRPELGGGELLYQRQPVLRCHVPGDKPLGHRHRDESYGRQPSEVNIWLPLTQVFGSNSLWAESARGREDWHPFECGWGECVRFWGCECEHFTKANE